MEEENWSGPLAFWHAPLCTHLHIHKHVHMYTHHIYTENKEKYVALPIYFLFVLCFVPSKDKSTSQVVESQVKYGPPQFW